jgi:hypothetical protein
MEDEELSFPALPTGDLAEADPMAEIPEGKQVRFASGKQIKDVSLVGCLGLMCAF